MLVKRGMIKSRKALSDVVTTGLIILLAIAAVVIVWGFVSPALTGVGERITTNCITATAKPTSCTITCTDADSDGKCDSPPGGLVTASTVSVQAGSGDKILSSVRLIYYEGAEGKGASQVKYASCTDLEPVSTSNCNPLDRDGNPSYPTGTPLSVSVAPVIGEDVCEETKITVPCTIV
jgi:hypothetical protein